MESMYHEQLEKNGVGYCLFTHLISIYEQSYNWGSTTDPPHSVHSHTIPKVDNSKFKCDGRTHCSQMNSCEEAIFFIQNCPNTKMDGNNDGIPCEKQWCGK